MKPRLARLVKLHALRSSMADAASMEMKRIEGDLQDAAGTLNALGASTRWAQAQGAKAYAESAWLCYRAQSEVASRLQAITADRMTELQVERAAAAEEQKAAVLAREQALRMRDRCASELRVEADRREQAHLDEAHLVSLVRKSLPTRF